MTTIAYRDGVIAADTLAHIHDGNTRMPGRVQKIWRLPNSALVGYAGKIRQAHALQQWLGAGSVGDPPDLDDVAAIVIRDRGASILIIDGQSQREIEAPFYAMGSGANAALGAMYAGATAIQAVRIAALVDPWTGGDVESFEVAG